MLPDDLQIKIESKLRAFGITSSLKGFGAFDALNVQGTTSGAVVDFGSFLVKPKFERSVALLYDREGNVTANTLAFSIGSPQFVQPDPELRIPFELWGYSVSGNADPKYDNPFIWSHELAAALANGTATRSDAEQHVRNLLGPVDAILAKIPKHCAAVFGASH